MKVFTYNITILDRKFNEIDGRFTNEKMNSLFISSCNDYIKCEDNIVHFTEYKGETYNIIFDGIPVIELIFRSSYEYNEENENTIKTLINITTEKLQKRNFDSAITLIEAIKKLCKE